MDRLVNPTTRSLRLDRTGVGAYAPHREDVGPAIGILVGLTFS
jgi:hypothetical protein